VATESNGQGESHVVQPHHSDAQRLHAAYLFFRKLSVRYCPTKSSVASRTPKAAS
jgi:hypothetical protein